MITVNGKKYAATKKELTESLFQSGGTACGTYKKLKNSINLFKPDGTLFAAVINNGHCEPFFVTAYRRDGKTWYMNGLDSVSARYLGLDSLSYSATSAIASGATK